MNTDKIVETQSISVTVSNPVSNLSPIKTTSTGPLTSHDISIHKLKKELIEEKIISCSNEIFKDQSLVNQEELDENQIFDSKQFEQLNDSPKTQDLKISELAMKIEVKGRSTEDDNQSFNPLLNKNSISNSIENQVKIILNEDVNINANENSENKIEEFQDEDFDFDISEDLSFDNIDQKEETYENQLVESNILEKEGDMLAKEGDILAKESDILAKESDILANEGDILAKVSDIVGKKSDNIEEKSNKVTEKSTIVEKKGEKIITVTKENKFVNTNKAKTKSSLIQKQQILQIENYYKNFFDSEGFSGIKPEFIHKVIKNHVEFNRSEEKDYTTKLGLHILKENINAGGVTKDGIPQNYATYKQYKNQFKIKFGIFYDLELKKIFDSIRADIEKESQSKTNESRNKNVLFQSGNEFKDTKLPELVSVRVSINPVSDSKSKKILEERLAELSSKMQALQDTRKEQEDEKHFELMHSIIQREIMKMELMSEEIKKKSLQTNILSHDILTAELKPPHTFLIGEVR